MLRTYIRDAVVMLAIVAALWLLQEAKHERMIQETVSQFKASGINMQTVDMICAGRVCKELKPNAQ